MKFSAFLVNGQTEVYPGYCKRAKAEIPSLQPQSDILDITYNPRSAQEAIALIYLCTWWEFWQTDKIIWTIANRAYAGNYQGKWKEVQQLLEEQLTTPDDFFQAYTTKLGHHPREFYGNIVKMAYRLDKVIKVNRYNPERRTRKVIPVNTRDYKDKGSRRLPHQFHGDPPVKSYRQDLRDYIAHPLLSSKNRKRRIKLRKHPSRGKVSWNMSQKGGIRNDHWRERSSTIRIIRSSETS